MANLVFITSIENWNVIKEHYIMGLGGRGNEIFPRIKNGDKCLIYVKKLCSFSGLFEITNKYSKQKIKWRQGQYQRLLDLNPIIIPEEPIPIKKHIDHLNFIKNKKAWMVYFRFPKFFSDKDLEYIIEIMKNLH